MKKISLLIALLLSLVLVSAVNALPVTLDKVEVDDVELSASAVNRLSVERGQDVEVEVRLSSSDKLKNVEVEAFLSGFEYNDVSRVSDLTQVFDMDTNVTYVKKLRLKLSDLVEEDDYKLRIIVSDRNNDELVENFALKVDVPRHGLKIKNLVQTPEGSVRAGQALLAKVRLRNMGEKDERDVKVTFSLPDLGVSGTTFVDEVENNDKEEESEEVYLRLPKCAKEGTYLLKVDVEFDNNHRKVSETKPVTLLANEDCKEGTSQQKSVTLGSSLENVKRGGSALFPVTLTNNEKTSKSFSLNVNAPQGLTVKVSPTSTVLLNAGETQTIYVTVASDQTTPLGALSLSGSVTSGSDVLQQLTFTLNVGDDSSASALNVKDVLQVALVVLLALLILVGLVFAFSRLKDNGEETPRKKSKAETYY